jgi:hypothetical protein
MFISGCKDGGKILNGQYLVCGIFLAIGNGELPQPSL